MPVFPLGKDERHGAIADAHDAKERAEREEHWRLLYVAMTRAEELLIVTGTRKADELPEGNWHSAVDAVMADMGADWQDAGPRWGQKRVHAVTGQGARGEGQGAAGRAAGGRARVGAASRRPRKRARRVRSRRRRWATMMWRRCRRARRARRR